MMQRRWHAACVALGDRAALVRGASGSGKSDLALRFLALSPGPVTGHCAPELVADDQVIVERRLTADGVSFLEARAPDALAGKLEVRGLGVVSLPARAWAKLVVVVDLVAHAQVERLPDPVPQETLLGVPLPVYRIAPHEGSAPMKLALTIAMADGLGAPHG